jgi:thioredoxin-related protein
MRAAIGTIVFIVSLHSMTSAQEGGKLNWKGRTNDPRTAMLDARDQGKPIMLYFMSVGCPYCKELEDGAFSNPKVVEASSNVACIFVDCDWGKKNQELSKKFGVNELPTVVFCDPEGNSLGRLQARDPDTVAKALKGLGEQVGAKAPQDVQTLRGLDYEHARAEALRMSRLLLVYFGDSSPASLSVNESLLDGSLRDFHDKFSCAKVEFVRGSTECLKFDVTRAPTILILDPRLAKPQEKPLARIEGSRSARELHRDLEAALSARDSGSRTQTATEGTPLPARRETPPQEKLSDDVIERKFIWARVTVAQETLKRGNKEKAIEILEDVLKSYPKHKDTEEVRKVLEGMRK